MHVTLRKAMIDFIYRDKGNRFYWIGCWLIITVYKWKYRKNKLIRFDDMRLLWCWRSWYTTRYEFIVSRKNKKDLASIMAYHKDKHGK